MELVLIKDSKIDVKLEKYLREITNKIGDKIKKAEAQKAAMLLKNTAKEVQKNLAFFSNYKFENLKAVPINSSEIKRILNKEISFKYTVQFSDFVTKNPTLKLKDKKNLIDLLNLVLFKINELKLYANKTDKELKKFTPKRPLRRFSSIRSVYVKIIKAVR
jgi:hypothetical protein